MTIANMPAVPPIPPMAFSVTTAVQLFAAGVNVVYCVQAQRTMMCVTAAEAEVFFLGERYPETVHG